MPHRYDLAIIGGGTNGPAILLTALVSGIKNAVLIEKGQIGRGKNDNAANCAATGLIQPGAKYLKSDRRLVKADALDCRLLKSVAGDFLKEMPFIMPALKNYPLPYCEPLFLDYYFGAYDKFSRLCLHPNHKRLSKEEVLDLEPGLKKEIWGGILFYEWVVNPPELSTAFVEAAKKLGGTVLEQSEVIGFEMKNTANDKVIESAAVRSESGVTEEIRARYFINACGAWTPQIAKFLGFNLKLRLTKGTSIIVNKQLTNNAVILFDEYGHYTAVLPQEEATLIGPTNKDVAEEIYENPDEVRPQLCEIKELLKTANNGFRNRISEEEIARPPKCGLRPQLNHQNKPPFDVTHQYGIFDHKKDGAANIISLAGGKLSMQLRMAKEAVETACDNLGIKFSWGIPKFTLGGKRATIGIPRRQYKKKIGLELSCKADVDEKIFTETLLRKILSMLGLCKDAIRQICMKLVKKEDSDA